MWLACERNSSTSYSLGTNPSYGDMGKTLSNSNAPGVRPIFIAQLQEI